MTDENDLLKTEAIYYSAPIPRDTSVLTVLGTVFDKVYFPGVYLPKGGFDQKDVEKEISRLESLDGPSRGNKRDVLIGMLKFTRFAKTLEGFCEFTETFDRALQETKDISHDMVEDIYYTLYGPRRSDWRPMFEQTVFKQLHGSDESIVFPGDYHYLALALTQSSKTGIPLLNDLPGLPIPGIEQATPLDDARALATLLAIECTRVALPAIPVLSPTDLMEFREENKETLRVFRRSMLRYAADLNEKIAGASYEEFTAKTRFFVDTEIVPALDELRSALSSKQSWSKRALNGLRVLPEIGAAFFTMGRDAAIATALTKYAAQFFTEITDTGDRREALKRSGLYYLLRLQSHADKKTG